MPRFCQLVVGPAGSGKSTYCSTIVRHCENIHRSVHVFNLDPAAEHFNYPVTADIRDLIQLEDVMEDQEMRYFVQNLDWLRENIGDADDEYFIFDCPGQIELYTHIPVMKQLVDYLQGLDCRVCAVFLVDAQFMIDAHKFVSGVMTALSTMIPHVNVLSKLDLLNSRARKELERFLEPDMHTLLTEELQESQREQKFAKLNHAIGKLVDDYSLVRFAPLDNTDELSVEALLYQIDTALQYGEDLDPKEAKEFDREIDDVDFSTIDANG